VTQTRTLVKSLELYIIKLQEALVINKETGYSPQNMYDLAIALGEYKAETSPYYRWLYRKGEACNSYSLAYMGLNHRCASSLEGFNNDRVYNATGRYALDSRFGRENIYCDQERYKKLIADAELDVRIFLNNKTHAPTLNYSSASLKITMEEATSYFARGNQSEVFITNYLRMIDDALKSCSGENKDKKSNDINIVTHDEIQFKLIEINIEKAKAMRDCHYTADIPSKKTDYAKKVAELKLLIDYLTTPRSSLYEFFSRRPKALSAALTSAKSKIEYPREELYGQRNTG